MQLARKVLDTINPFNSRKTAYMHDCMLKAAENNAKYTPDLVDIERRSAHLVFIYNELKTGRHEKLQLAGRREATAFTSSAYPLVMMKKDLGRESYPIVKLIQEDEMFGKTSHLGKPAQIKGELWLIRPYSLIDLDNYMLNTVQFIRVRAKLEVPYRERVFQGDISCLGPRHVEETMAWMYIAHSDFWSDQIKANRLKTTKLFTANHGKDDLEVQYYSYEAKLENNAA